MELTIFKLKNCTAADFIAANKEIDEFLIRQPGFRIRRMSELEDGTIMDMLLWDSEENSVQAMTLLMSETRDSVVHSMIDQQTVSWNVATVQHSLNQPSIA